MIYYKPMENNAQRCKKPFREWRKMQQNTIDVK